MASDVADDSSVVIRLANTFFISENVGDGFARTEPLTRSCIEIHRVNPCD